MSFFSMIGERYRKRHAIKQPPSDLDNLVADERVKQAQAFIFPLLPHFVPTWPVDVPSISVVVHYDDGKSLMIDIAKPMLMDGEQK